MRSRNSRTFIYVAHCSRLATGGHKVDKSEFGGEALLGKLGMGELHEGIVGRTACAALGGVHSGPVETLTDTHAPAVVAGRAPQVFALYLRAGEHGVGRRGERRRAQLGLSGAHGGIGRSDGCGQRINVGGMAGDGSGGEQSYYQRLSHFFLRLMSW